MMRNNIFLWLCLSLFVAACQRNDDITKDIRSLYRDRGIVFDEKLEHCLILPEVGCDGCIAGGVSFLLNNKHCFSDDQIRNKVVFTAVNSKKMLLRNLKFDSLEGFNCVLDTANHYLVKGDNAIYPLVLYLKDGIIIKAEFQSPRSADVLSKLKIKL